MFFGLLYITPTMYPTESAPPIIQKVIQINPLTHIVLVFRDVWLPSSMQTGIHWGSWVYFAACAVIMLTAGHIITQKTKRVVGDLV